MRLDKKSKTFLSNEIDYMKLYLLIKLKALSNEQITLINNRICKNENLVGEIIKYLDSNIDKNIKMNNDELEYIENLVALLNNNTSNCTKEYN